MGHVRTLPAGELEVDDAEGAAYVRQLPGIVSEARGREVQGTSEDDAPSDADPMAPAPEHRLTKPGRYRRKKG